MTRIAVGWALLIALLSLGCKKSEGAVCQKRSECAEGLGCMGEDVRRCERCDAWEGCTLVGKCTFDKGLCVVGGEADCKQSAECKERSACKVLDGVCATDAEIAAAEAAARDPGRFRAGCPCGCDRSEAMTEELAARGRAGLPEARSSLATISERERAGFITEAMVQHRLRLVALHQALGEDVVRASALPASPFVAEANDAGLRVRGDLIVHGEQIEIVRGRQKLQRASFVWRVAIANLGRQKIVLSQPTIDAAVSFPVSRWYREGTDGEPWDGVIAAGEDARVRIIGYVGEPVKPGTRIAARLHVDALTIAEQTTARLRWDQPSQHDAGLSEGAEQRLQHGLDEER